MQKIKIAHVVCGLDGGVGNVILNYFAHMPMEDYEVHILSNDISSQLYLKQFEKRGFRVIEVPKSSMNVLQRIKRWKELMQEYQYDIVHCHQTLTNIFPLYSAKKSDVPVRISHSHLVTNPHGSLKDRVLTFLNHKCSKYLATDCMACGIEAGKSLFGLKSPFTVLNNALKLEDYRFDPEVRAVEREKLHLQDNEFVIGHVGRFTHQKNHKFLLEVFAAFWKRCPDAKLLLIGEGELMDEIKAYTTDLGVAERVVYTGAIQDVPRKLQAMDLFMLPSLSEGLPVVALEAQAAGLPCIISESVTREVDVIPEVTYLSLDASMETWCDAMVKYQGVRSENTIERLREYGYDITIEAKKLDAFYKNAVKNKK